MPTLSPAVQTCLLLVCSNVFMTIAWYGHLQHLRAAPLVVAVLVSWFIALAEYALQVPANRIGYGRFTLAQHGKRSVAEIVGQLRFRPGP